MRHDPLVGVNLDNAEHFDAEITLRQVAVWGTDTGQGEALSAERNDGRRYTCHSLGKSSNIRDHGIAAFPDTDIRHAPVIVDKTIVGQHLGYCQPISGSDMGKEAVCCSARRILWGAHLRAQFLKAGERGVYVCLVKNLVAADPTVFEGQQLDHSPLGLKASLRGPTRYGCHDRSEFAQPVHSLDVHAEVRRDIPHATRSCGEINCFARYEPSVIDAHRIYCHCRKFVPIEPGVRPDNHRPRVRVNGGFASEIASVEFLEGGVDVVEVE
jgi:hypothetical protein